MHTLQPVLASELQMQLLLLLPVCSGKHASWGLLCLLCTMTRFGGQSGWCLVHAEHDVTIACIALEIDLT